MPDEVLKEFWQIIPTVVYFFLGLGLFSIALFLADKLLPFSLRKEIEEDQNTALGIIIGSGVIATAIILSSVLK